MFTIEEKNIQYGFKVLSDSAERNRLYHNLEKHNPNLYFLIFGQGGTGGALRTIGEIVISKSPGKDAYAQNNIKLAAQRAFVQVLFFSFSVIASANANRGSNFKDPPTPEQNPDFNYWLPDVDLRQIKDLSDDNQSMVAACQESLQIIDSISPLFCRFLRCLIEAYDPPAYAVFIIYILTRLILEETKKFYEWERRQLAGTY